ncbi:18597_t:CDS:2, partial [Acaulospora morrowiae]
RKLDYFLLSEEALLTYSIMLYKESRPLNDEIRICFAGWITVIYTPVGGVAVGATIMIQWNYTTVPTRLGILNIVSNTTSRMTLINDNLDLTPREYSWIVNVPPGIYYFTLNDGSGNQYSGEFSVYVPGGTTPVLSTSATRTVSSSRALSITSNSASLTVQITVQTTNVPTKTKSQTTRSGSASTATIASIPGFNPLFYLFLVAAAMVKFA